ncbi:MAG: hypothetical protein EOL87_08020 [Spartobacteria bacterium]|nr:hypothetical protein [Spartobacteria bacterium]
MKNNRYDDNEVGTRNVSRAVKRFFQALEVFVFIPVRLLTKVPIIGSSSKKNSNHWNFLKSSISTQNRVAPDGVKECSPGALSLGTMSPISCAPDGVPDDVMTCDVSAECPAPRPGRRDLFDTATQRHGLWAMIMLHLRRMGSAGKVPVIRFFQSLKKYVLRDGDAFFWPNILKYKYHLFCLFMGIKRMNIRVLALLFIGSVFANYNVIGAVFDVRNLAGGATPSAPATIYLGDTDLTFQCDAWATYSNAGGGARVYIHTGSDIANGTTGAVYAYTGVEAKSNISGMFTQTGTWYWGILMHYNSDPNQYGWYCRNATSWGGAWDTPTSDLTVTVTALNTPTVGTIAKDGTTPSTKINLSWTRGTSTTVKDTVILRSTSSDFTGPSQGSGVTQGTTINSDEYVLYKGDGTSTSDTGLSPSTTYYYKMYAINNDYYSAGVTGNATTDAATEPTITVSSGTLAFGDLYINHTSSVSSYTVSGANLTADITNTAPTGFQISTANDSGFGSEVVLAQAGGTVNETTVYVIFAPETASSFDANILVASTDAADKTKNVTGTGRALPTDVTWDGGGTGNDWTTDDNWADSTYGATYPAAGSSTILRFGGATASPNNDYPADSAFSQILFNTGAESLTLGGNAVTLHLQVKNDDDSLQTVNNAITMGTAMAVDAEVGALTLGGTVANGGYQLTVKGGHDVIMSGAVSGTGNILKQETGTLTLSGDNSSLNPADAGTSLYIDNGTVYLAHNNAAGNNTDGIDVGAGFAGEHGPATLYAKGGITVANAITAQREDGETKTIGSDSTTDDQTFSGGVTLEESVTLTAASEHSVTFSGKVTGAGGITKTGEGTVVLAGAANDFAGAVAISAGTLQLSGDGRIPDGAAVTVAGTLDLNDISDAIESFSGAGTVDLGSGTLTAGSPSDGGTFSGNITGSGGFTYNESGTDILFLTGASDFEGALTLNDGILQLQNAAAAGTAAGGVTVESGAELRLFTATAGITYNADALFLAGTGDDGLGALRSYGGDNTWPGAITLAADSRINVYANSLVLDVTAGNAIAGAHNLTLGGDGNITINDPIAISTGSLTKDGAGTLTLSGANDFTGATLVSAGVMNLQHNTAMGTVVGGATVSSGAALQLQGGIAVGAEALSLSGTGVSSDGALRNISGDNSYAGAITLGADSRINSDADTLTLDVASDNAIDGTFNLAFGGAGDITVNDPIATGTGTLTKDGAGTLTLAAANTFSGATAINAGNITVASGGNLGSGSDVYVKSGATLTINNSCTVASLREAGMGDAGTASIASGQVLTINGADDGTYYMNTISGDGGLTFSGTGTSHMQLYGAPSYTGNTVINSGTLGSSDVLASPTVSIAAGATFVAADDYTFADGKTLAGISSSDTANLTATDHTVTMASGSLLTFEANDSSAGKITVTGNLTLNANAVTVNVSGTKLATGTYTLLDCSGTLSGTIGALTVTGLGLADNTYGELSVSGTEVTLTVSTYAVPTLATTPASSIDTTSATLGGEVTLSGGSAISDRGVVYKTTSPVAISDNKTQIGTGMGTFSVSVGSLAVNTRYYHRAYAINTTGTAMGDEADFYTLANAPGQPTVDTPTASSLNVTLAVNGNSAATEFAIRTDSKYVQADGSLDDSEVWQTVAVWGAVTITGLSAGTEYTVDAKARNGANTETAFGTSASASTRPTTVTWNGEDADDANWKSDDNWVGDQYPAASANTILRFAGSTRTSPVNNFDADSDFGSIYFNSGADAFTLSGNDFDLFGRIENNDDSLQTINNNITMRANVDIKSTVDGGSIVLGGTLNTGAEDYRLTVSNDYAVTITGNITGDGDILKNKAGTLTLSGDNSFASDDVTGLYVDQGTVYLNHNNAVSTNNIDVGRGYGGTSYDAALYAIGARTISNPIHVNSEDSGSRTIGSDSTTDDQVFTGPVSLEKTANFNAESGHLVKFEGIISGDGGITKTGAGMLKLDANNTFTGDIAINSGVVRAQKNEALGTVDGSTTVANGTALEIQGIITTPAEPLTLYGTGISDGGALRNTANDNTFAGPITLASASRINSDGGTLTLDVASGNAVAGGFGLTLGGAGNITVADPIATGANTVTKDGAGTVILSGVNTFSGALTVSAGTVQLGASDRIADTVDVAVAADATLALANFNDTIDSLTGAGHVTLGSGTLTVGGNDGDAIFSGDLSGIGGFTKTGSGTVTLSGANSHSGATAVNAGELEISGDCDDSAVTVGASGLLTGNGPVDSLTLNGRVAPKEGADVTVTLVADNNITLNNGGSFDVDLAALPSGTAGADWDLLQSTAGIIAANASGTFTINLYGSMGGFDQTAEYAWKIMDGSAAVTDFAAARFTVTDTLTLPESVTGEWSVEQDGNDINLVYTPLPAITIAGDDPAFGNVSINHTSAERSYTVSGANMRADVTVTAPDNFGISTTSGSEYDSSLTLSPTDGTLAETTIYVVFTPTAETDYSGNITHASTDAVTQNKAASGAGVALPGTATWDGGGGDNNWKTDDNWTGGVYPGAGSDTVLNFAGTTRTSPVNNYDAGSTFGTINFNDDAGSFSLGGNAFNLATCINNADDNLQTIANDITMDKATTEIDTVGDVTLSGNISGTGSILKEDAGTLILSGDNSSLSPSGTQSLYIDQGAVHLQHSNAAGASAKGIDLGKGVTGGDNWDAALYASGGVTIPNAITVKSQNGGSAALGSESTTDDQIFSGAVTLGKSATMTAGSGHSVTFSGAVGGVGGVTKTGVGTVVLSNEGNDFGGDVTISAGTLQLDGGNERIPDGAAVSIAASSALDLNDQDETIESFSGAGNVDLGTGTLTAGCGDDDSALSGVISGSGGFTYNESGTDVFKLSGANEFTGALTLSDGILQLESASASGTADGGVSVASGAELRLNDAGDGIAFNADTLTLSGTGNGAAAGALRNVDGDNTWQGALALGADTRMNSDADTLTVSGSIDANGNTLYVGGSGDMAIATLSEGSKTTDNGALFKDGTGTLSISGANATLSGSVYVREGKVSLSSATAIGSSGTAYVADDGDVAAYLTVSAGALTVAKAINIPNSGIGGVYIGNEGAGSVTFSGDFSVNRAFDLINTGGGSLTLSGTMDLNSDERDLVVANDVTVSGKITNGSLKKSDDGTLTISNTGNDYSGTTFVSAGTLKLGAAGVIPDTSDVAVNGTLNLNGNNETISALAGSGSLTLGAGNLICGDESDTTFSGVTTGSGGITKNGSGKLTLSGASSGYSGTLTAHAGTLVVNADYSGANWTVASGASLQGVGSLQALSISGNVSPGDGTANDAAQMSCTSVALNSGVYTWNCRDLNESAGTGYDQISASGAVNVGSGFEIVLDDTGIANWDYTQDHTWTVISGGSMANYEAGDITLDATGWSSERDGGIFSLIVDEANGDVKVMFSAQTRVIYDGFIYDAGTLDLASGGAGWLSVWSKLDLNGTPDFDYSATSLPGPYAIPDSLGGKSILEATANASRGGLKRMFRSVSSDTLYVAWRQSYSTRAQNHFAGVQLLQEDGTKTVFGGKVIGTTGTEVNRLGLYEGDATTTSVSGNAYPSSKELTAGFGNDYLIVMRYQFASDLLSITAYKNGKIAAEEPLDMYWATNRTVEIADIGGLILCGGSYAAGTSIGNTYFDEVRVGTNWNEVVRSGGIDGDIPAGPTASLVFVGADYDGSKTSTSITDAELVGNGGFGKLDVAVKWTANTAQGMFVTNDASDKNTTDYIFSTEGRILPNWDVVVSHDKVETEQGEDNIFNKNDGSMWVYGENGDLVVTTVVEEAFNVLESSIGDTYYITVSGENNGGLDMTSEGATVVAPNDANAVPVTRGITINQNMQFTVTDDDDVAPVNLRDSTPFAATAKTDADIRTGSWTLTLTEVVKDVYSGISDGNSVGSAPTFSMRNNADAYLISNQVFSADPSSTASNIAVTLTHTSIAAMDEEDTDLGTYDVLVTLNDSDNDRPGDYLALSNALVATITVTDDDTTPPTIGTASTDAGTAWTNVNTIDLSWDAATDVSGIAYYHYTALGDPAPESTNVGTSVANTITSISSIDVSGSNGELTGYVFAVDNDTDRGNDDRLKSDNMSYVVKLDHVAPTAPSGLGAAQGSDPTAEINLSWTASVDDGYSPWDTYKIYYTSDGEAPTKASSSVDSTDYSTLDTRTTTSVTLDDVVFGTTYKFAMSGVDSAGNEGDLSAVISHDVPGFNATSGVANASTGWPALGFDSVDGQTYDLIAADGPRYDPQQLGQKWRLIKSGVAEGTTSSLTDDATRVEGVDSPWILANGMMRFYRVASHDSWKTDRPKRLAAEEVYLAQPMYVKPGQNWVQLPGIPDSTNLVDVLGTYLPQGSSASLGTLVSLYDRNSAATPKKQAGLVTGGTWTYTVGGSGNANAMGLPLDEAFVIEIPTNSSAQIIKFMGRVPTNAITQTIYGSKAYNLVAFRLPRPMHPSELGLVEAGFTGGTTWPYSDWMWTFNRTDQRVPNIMYYNTGLGQWRFLNKNAVIPADYIKPDDGLVINTRVSINNFVWTNSIPYPLPDKELPPP